MWLGEINVAFNFLLSAWHLSDFTQSLRETQDNVKLWKILEKAH